MAATPSDLGPAQVGQISINVHDVDRAVSFYRDKLGLRYLFQVPKMAFFDCGGVRLLLGLPETPEFDHPGSVIYFKVLDIQASFQTLKERGVEFEGQPHLIAKLSDHDLWMAFFRDVDRNLLAVMSEVPRP